QRNIDEATGWLETTDDALSDAASVINRARELTVQGASDSLGPDQRQAIALEIDQLIEAVKESANATFQGTYVFSGAATTTAPYAAGSNVFGADPSGTVARTIGPGVSVKINTNANDIFGSGAPAAPDGKLISTLQSISAHLKTDTPAAHDALRNGDLADLSANLDTLSQARATRTPPSCGCTPWRTPTWPCRSRTRGASSPTTRSSWPTTRPRGSASTRPKRRPST